MNQKRILIVEDNATDEALIRRAIAEARVDVEVLVAHDGAEAVDLLAQTAVSRPSVVLLDLKLPKLDGHEVLAILRNRVETRRIPVVVLSSSAEIDDIRAAYEAGCNGYVQKPVDSEAFMKAVGALARFWLGVNLGPGGE